MRVDTPLYPNNKIAMLGLPDEPHRCTPEQLRRIWEYGRDIPLNYTEDGHTLVPIEGVEDSDVEECIDQDYWIWLRGTFRMTIWEWFDDHYPGGLHQLQEDLMERFGEEE